MSNEFIYTLRTHIEDTDFAGVVYHSNYLKFMERARSEWMEALGYGIHWQRAQHLYFPVHSINIVYLKPVRLHEKIEVVSKISAVRQASILYDQYLRRPDAPDKILCKAEVKLACVNDDIQPCPIPQPVFETIRRMLT